MVNQQNQQFEYAAEDDVEQRLEREGRRLRISAGAMLVVVVIAGLAYFPSSFDPAAFLILAMQLSVIIACAVFVFQAAQLLVDEPSREVIHALLGHPLAVRTKSRFLNRLDHECNDARLKARHRAFSVVVVSLPPGDDRMRDAERLAITRRALRASIRARDIMADAGNGELWVLAIGAGRVAADALGGRLRGMLSAMFAHDGGPQPLTGWSTFEADAADANGLIELARQRGYVAGEDTRAAA